uniref:SelT-like protein n=1 Tax=Caenorhabditis tropicalis TaxID=1561998 RepID=A0A1I7U757_9PELO
MLSKSGAFIIVIVFLMSISDVFKAEEVSNEKDYSVKEIEDETIIEKRTNDGGLIQDDLQIVQDSKTEQFPILKILYCVSCGYKQAFTQFSEFAKEKYPDLPIEGGNFPQNPLKTHLAHVSIWHQNGLSFTVQSIGLIKIILLILIMTGSNPFESIGFGYPYLLQHAHMNKLSSGMLVYMIGNMIESSLLSTGAFEIFIGGEQIWSKMESGRVPSQEEFIGLIGEKLVKYSN